MPEPPSVGTLAHDTKRDRVGVAMARHNGRFCLRPQGGGQQWDAEPRDVKPVTADEALRLRVRDANERSWGTRL
ncbi:hypothetical protein [Streptomyces orinoci]|uniref:Uncharacterized protein n=1 Tax=Streptomyces orinoci TaxID=67339 RepID=A0ABV3K326_STRON|nr:hypothetical protein [Streptomyces orinoci]